MTQLSQVTVLYTLLILNKMHISVLYQVVYLANTACDLWYILCCPMNPCAVLFCNLMVLFRPIMSRRLAVHY